MKERDYFIGIDVHKRYSWVTIINKKGEEVKQIKLFQNEKDFKNFFSPLANCGIAAIEATCSWYRAADIFDSINLDFTLSNPTETKAIAHAKLQNDKVDSKMLAKLLRADLLPESYAAPRELRDKRQLPRYRMIVRGSITKIKNRIHSIVDQYWLNNLELSDVFSEIGKNYLKEEILPKLPTETRRVLKMLLRDLKHQEKTLKQIEKRIKKLFVPDKDTKRILTTPGIGITLGTVIQTEIAQIERFRNHEAFCLYSGVVSANKASAGKIYSSRTPRQCNHYLKWAFIEAANVIVRSKCDKNLVNFYEKVKSRRGKEKAKVALARKLATAVFYILKRKENYKTPNCQSSNLVGPKRR